MAGFVKMLLLPRATRQLVATAVVFSAVAAAAQADDLQVKSIGSFYIPGHEVTLSGLPASEIATSPGMAPFHYDPNGEFETGQMYVQYVQLAHPSAKYPLLLWHGGGLSGVTWETKPDGQPGWQSYFLHAGHSVYISDAVERGRATWSRFPEIYSSPPIFRTKKEAWELFRIGPKYSDHATKTAFSDTQFPVDSFDAFMRQSNPRWLTNDDATQKAYDAYVQAVCPCVILVHSQGSYFGFTAALHAPDKVKALIAIEPSSAPDPTKTDVSALKSVPHLFVWGDHIKDSPLWPRFQGVASRYREALTTAGVPNDWLDLPSQGLHGNTHMMMMDRNSDQVAALIQAWMKKQGLMQQ
jgi:pimeloyl-ACP methyl ester carboxylesterase